MPGQISVTVGRRFDESDGKHGSAAYYASLVSSFSPQQERLDSVDEKAAIVNEETRHSRQAASLFLMAHECPSRSSRLPDADETTVCMVVGGWFAAGATHHFDAGVPNISISFVDCRPAPLGGLVPRNPLNETSPSGSSYLVGPRESHLDLHHLLWSLLSWIAVMTVTCYSKKSSTPCASKDRVRRQQVGAIYFRQSHGDSVAKFHHLEFPCASRDRVRRQ